MALPKLPSLSQRSVLSVEIKGERLREMSDFCITASVISLESQSFLSIKPMRLGASRIRSTLKRNGIVIHGIP